MDKQDFITVTPIHLIGEDERGATHDFTIRETTDFVLIHRKTGTMSGNTYHEGKSKGTNPKTFVLLSGKILFRYRHIEENHHHECTIDYPAIIEVKPLVIHSVEAMTDIAMLECNSILDIQADRTRKKVIKG